MRSPREILPPLAENRRRIQIQTVAGLRASSWQCARRDSRRAWRTPPPSPRPRLEFTHSDDGESTLHNTRSIVRHIGENGHERERERPGDTFAKNDTRATNPSTPVGWDAASATRVGLALLRCARARALCRQLCRLALRALLAFLALELEFGATARRLSHTHTAGVFL